MIPASFDYRRPANLEEAIALLQEHGEEAKLLAGGHSLIPVLKMRLARPALLIDIGRIADLKGVSLSDGSLSVGALTTHHEIERSDLVRRRCPLLAEAASEIGDVQVRNRGTVGGSLAHADPAADYPAAMIALGAEIVATGPEGAHSILADNFFTGPLETSLRESEILTSVRIPLPAAERTGGAYRKAAQPASGFAICGVAVQLSVGEDGSVEQVGVGITGVAPSAYRAEEVEKALAGQRPAAEALKTAAARAAEGVEPLEDLYASGPFREHLARVWTERALQAALKNADGRS